MGFVEVSIHAPARGATDVAPEGDGVARVSIHAPARGATPTPPTPTTPTACFNSRAREGRDINFLPVALVQIVSIHAPARGATVMPLFPRQQDEFQFTRPRGARPRRTSARYGNLPNVSIHAPARGATYAWLPRRGAYWVSIHAPARGATEQLGGVAESKAFQFTRPRGARPAMPSSDSASACFNSRAREGRDLSPSARLSQRSRFNSRAREGRDSTAWGHRERQGRFNSRAREGRDMRRGGRSPRAYPFQFTRPRGARP